MRRRTQAAPGPVNLVLYDGVCGLCNRLVKFVLRRDRRRVFRFASLQSDLGQRLVREAGGDPRELDSFYVIPDYGRPDARIVARGRAALFVAAALGWPWRAATILVPLPTAILDRVYAIVARNRYRLFGRSDECLVPDASDRNRFIE